MENEKIYYSKTLEEFNRLTKSKYPDTLNKLLDDFTAKYSEKPAVGFTSVPSITYREFFTKVLSISDLLLKRGVRKGDRIAILGENSPNWGIAYFSIIRTGAAVVPILADFPDADIRHILTESEVKILFTTQKQLEKISDLDHSRIKLLIMLDDFHTNTHDLIKTETLADIFDKAMDFIKKIPKTIGLVSTDISEDDVASIIYTSGTSGHSKAVMLTHKNLISNVTAISSLIDINTSDTFLSILPLPHVYEFTLGFLLPLLNGARIVYIDKVPTPRILEKVCKVERPTAICAVPLIMEKIFKKKVLPVLKKNLPIKVLTKLPVVKKKIYKEINRKIIDFFGGRLRVMAIGGAPFNREAEKFFNKAGFPYIIGYGLTETSPLIAGGPFGDKSIRYASTGKPTPGCQLKIINPDEKTGIGEILGRGPNIMKGYYKNPELTAQVMDEEGWFKTGDLGYFDKHNNLYIMGRSKNMILMSNGENIYPEAIEQKLNACFHVSESLVIENNNLLEAWVHLDYDLIDSETVGKLESQRYKYIEQILAGIKENVNENLSSFSKISKLFEQEEPFVKTATHKIKRYLYAHTEKK
ncbi:MAG: long-chain fatty acid--CoA ligase [bacterium]|nr:long-chain fatty acid--CoA ligase [bacterium]